jgi:hypothetical protein
MNNKGEMLVSRLLNLWRKPLPRPVRKGKTTRDHASGSWVARLQNRQARASEQNSTTFGRA